MRYFTHHMHHYRFTSLLLLFSMALCGQTAKYPVVSLPVVRNGIILSNPWTGGFDAPEFSSADIDHDGINDLFVFDRSGNKVMVFISTGGRGDTTYHYAPEYEKLFPALNTWAVLRDYNNDGVPDIFTNQPGETLPGGTVIPAGIEVYKGSRAQGNIHFDVDRYNLNYFDTPYTINLWANGLGVPSIVDVDGDGALDILTFGVFGSTVEYYQNISAQLGLPPDSLVFKQVTTCWGNFYVIGATLSVSLGVSCKGGGPYNPTPGERHTGATIWPVQERNGMVDGLLAGAHVSNMVFMKNTGNRQYADVGWQDTLWPSCNTPVYSPLFPAVFQLDADNDGQADLLIAPDFGNPSPALNTNNVQFYQGIAGDTCGYQYNGNDSFLVHTTLDFGSDSKVAFFDYNGDSLMDIVVGNLMYYDPIVQGVSQLGLYRNTGSLGHPKFELISTDYLGLSRYNLQAIYPAFGDLDGDGKADLVIGDATGNISFFKNTGDTLAAFPSMTGSSYFNINVGTYAAPFIYDINNDGLPDLLIGNANGTLAYYWNFGTATHPLFSPDSANATFGNINVTLPTATTGNSQPSIMRDATGAMLLLVGTAQGVVYEYLVDSLHLRQGAFTRLDSNFLQNTVGANATIQPCDLNGDGKMEYLAGCSRGGLQLFSESVWDSSVVLANQNIDPVENELQVYPNPANAQFKCVAPALSGNVIQPNLFNVFGQRIDITYARIQNGVEFNTTDLVAGMYIVRIETEGRVLSARIMVAHSW